MSSVDAPTVTVTDFLLARFAEVEAEWAQGSPNWYEHDDGLIRFMLADVEAKRRTLEIAKLFGCANVVARYLAVPYADHADYREEWRP